MNMFKPTKATTPEEYIEMIEEPRRSEIQKLDKMIHEIAPNLKRSMFNSVIGYGTFHYKSKSGQEGEWFVIGLASQKNYISLYVCATDGKRYMAEKFKDRLPKASIGKSCVRIRRLSDVDEKILRELIRVGSEFKGW